MEPVTSGNGRGLSDRETLRTPEAAIERVVVDARRSWGHIVDDGQLTTWAGQAVTELWGDSVKVTTFVPLLAMRSMKERVEQNAVPVAV